MLVDISLDCVVSQRPLYGTLVGFLRTLSLLFPYSRRMMIVLRRSLYCVFLTSIIWPFRSIATTIFDRVYPGSKHFVRSGFCPNYVSQCCVRLVSLTVPKPLDSCSTFLKSIVTSRAFPSHFVSWIRAGSSPCPYTQCGIGVPSEKAAVRWRSFLDALLYYQFEGC